MSYRADSIKAAPKGTLCGWTYGKGRYSTCMGDHGKPSLAVHILLKSLPVAPAGTALCGYHSPFDVLFSYEGETYLKHSGPNASGYYKLISRNAVTIHVHQDDKGLVSI